MSDVVGLVAVLGIFGSIIITVYLFFSSRHKQRMALMEHGQDASIFRMLNDKSVNLKYGLVALGIGFGIITGYLLSEVVGLEEAPSYFAMILILGGAGLLLYYRLVKDEEDQV